jgi:hypothetical protein
MLILRLDNPLTSAYHIAFRRTQKDERHSNNPSDFLGYIPNPALAGPFGMLRDNT